MRSVLLVLMLFGWGTAALAQSAPNYEEALIDWGLGVHQRERESAPEGLPIEEILVASEDVIAQSDPWPSLFNVFHIRTHDSVIRRELLFSEGEPYQAWLTHGEQIRDAYLRNPRHEQQKDIAPGAFGTGNP